MSKFFLISFVSIVLAPSLAFAQTNPAALGGPTLGTVLPNNQGIFGCNQTGAYAMSVGSTRAVGGTFVPVSDSAVTLNTGYLVYKECVLRPVVSSQVHAASGAYVNAKMQTFLKGNNGNPYFVQNYGQEQFQAGDRAFNNTFYTVTGAINPALQNQVQRVIARNYAQVTQQPQLSLACPYSGNLNAVTLGRTTDVWGGIEAKMNPACSGLWVEIMAQDQLMSNYAAAQDAWRTQVTWGNGLYPITDSTGRIVTPAILVGAVAGQALTSGFRQLESANDIGQMVGALFAGVGNRILNGGLGGLASLASAVGTQPSYLSQVTQEASRGLAQAITNVALTVLAPALAIEKNYSSAQNKMAQDLAAAFAQLKGAETTCMNLIVSSACAASSTPSTGSGGATCQTSDGTTLHIATSTPFVQAVVSAQIKPLADAVKQNTDTSNRAITAIETLIASVQNTNSSEIQRTALQQLDTLVAQSALHTQPDLDRANQQASDLHAALFDQSTGLIPQTLHQWTGDDTTNGIFGAVAWDGSSAVGWCNVPSGSGTPSPQQTTTLQKWIQRWSAPLTP